MLTRIDKKKAQERNRDWEEQRKKLETQHAWGPEPFGSEYGPKIAKFLQKELDRAIDTESDGYEDNFRYARKSNPKDVARYEYHASTGCCGSHDREVMGPDGEVYLIGFNYGH